MLTPDLLAALERQFHAVVRERAGRLVDEHDVALPDFAAEPPPVGPPAWFPVPGMAGGFSYRLTSEAPPVLSVESWSRVVAGSGQRHEVTPDGYRLVDEGFV